MANRPGPQRALGSRGQTINASSWPYFDALLRAVSARTGVNYDTLIVEGTRTYERQAFLYANRFKPGFNPAYPPDSPYAYHVAGDAVDFGAGAGTRGTPVQRALHELGPSFGIFFEVSNELWHGRCDLSRVPNLNPAGSGATPIENEDDELNAEEKAQLRFLYEVLSAPGPVNGGTPLIQQISGAFRDSAEASKQASAAAIDAYEAKKLSQSIFAAVFTGGDSMPDKDGNGFGRPLGQSLADLRAIGEATNNLIAVQQPDDLKAGRPSLRDQIRNLYDGTFKSGTSIPDGNIVSMLRQLLGKEPRK